MNMFYLFAACRPLARLSLILILAVSALGCAKKTPEELLEEGIALLQSQDIFGAELKFQDLLQKYPDSEAAPRAQIGLAYCYEQDKRFDEARAAYDKVIQMAGGAQTPMGFDSFQRRINTYMDPANRNPAQALQDVLATSATLSGAPDELKFAYGQMLADLYHLTENDDKSLEVLGNLSRTPPSDNRHLAVMERVEQIYRNREQLDLAVKAYQDYIASFPDSPMTRPMRFKIALVEKERGNFEVSETLLGELEAELSALEVKAIGGDEKSAMLMELAGLRLTRANFEGARSALKRIIEEFPLSPARADALFMLARIEHDQGNPTEAIALLNKIAQEFANTQAAAVAMNSIREIEAGASATTGTLPSTGTLTTTGSLTETLATSATLPQAAEALTTDSATSPTQ